MILVVKKVFGYIRFVFYVLFEKQRIFRDRAMYRVKINKIINTHPKLKNKNKDKAYLKECREFLKKNFDGYRNTKWHYFYSTLNGIKKVEYIPEELFFALVEPVINNPRVSSAYTDKNAYSLFIDKMYLPKTIFKMVKGRFYDEESDIVEKPKALQIISEIEELLILKPAVHSGGGKNIIIERGNKIAESLTKNPIYRKDDFTLQYFARQHSGVAAFHPASLNTFRIITSRVNNDFMINFACFRMGRNNKLMDNTVAGGLYTNVTKDGRLEKYAYDNKSLTYERHPDSGIIFENYQIPGYHNVIDFCKQHHKKLIHFNIISWDVGVQENGTPLFIEFNLGAQAINGAQLFNGPLFGENTSYFIDLYHEMKNNRRRTDHKIKI